MAVSAGSHKNGGSSGHAPLLATKAEKEQSSPKSAEQFWAYWKLAFFTFMLLITSVGNTVYFKRMTSAMPNYGWYLTQLSTTIYVPVFAAMAGTGIVESCKNTSLIRKFALMGIFDGLSGTLMVLGGVHTSGTMQVLLTQAVIPVTMFCSSMLIGKRFHMLQHAGAGAIVLGIVLSKATSSADASAADQDNTIFNVLFFLAVVPSAFSSVFKEVAFRGFDGDLDVNVLQFYVALFQVFVNFLAMPIYTLKMLGPQQVPLSEMPQVVFGGSRCLFLFEDQVKENCGFLGERPCDQCQDAWLPVVGYLVFNLSYNIFIMLVIKHGSAALSFLVATLRMPLSSLAFASTTIMGSEAVQPSMGDLVSLLVIICGLSCYRYGGQLLHRREEAKAVQPDSSPRSPWPSPTRGSWLRSPASPASPSTSETRPGFGRGGSRWSFVPLFNTMAPGMEPVFVYVPQQSTPKPRSADRVRTDLYRRLGHSPLQSPGFRDRSPTRSPFASPGALDAVPPSVADFSLSGMPP